MNTASAITEEFNRVGRIVAHSVGDVPAALEDRVALLAKALSWQECDSPMAALHMLGVALYDADSLADWCHGNESSFKIDATISGITRMIFAVVRWIEETHGVNREDHALEYYLADVAEKRARGILRQAEAA